jgi:hypothetical protein
VTLTLLSMRLLGLGLIAVSWNAVTIRGLQLGDMVLLVTMPLLLLDALASRRPFRFPALLILGTALIFLAGVWTAISPVDGSYLTSRYEAVLGFQRYLTRDLGGTDLAQLAKFLVALVALPLAITLAARSREDARYLANCWAVGILLSAIVAALDHRGLTAINTALTGFTSVTGRDAGLTLQPNHLSVSLVLVLPVILSWLRRNTPSRAAAWPALAIVAYGLYTTGSRGGIAGMLLALAVTGLFVQHLRTTLLRISMAIALVSLVGYRYVADVVRQVLINNRLTDNPTAALSNSERARAIGQGWDDFLHSPLHGIGFSYVSQAHEVHLQMLAAGGLLGLMGYLLYVLGVLKSLRAAMTADRLLGGALAASFVTWLLLGFTQNQLTDRYLYVPVGLLLALASLSARERKLGWGQPLEPESSSGQAATAAKMSAVAAGGQPGSR